MNWMETLQEYDYEILYVQGKSNVVADALSRTNESHSSELYTGEEEEEISEAVAVNVVGMGVIGGTFRARTVKDSLTRL
jgi:hypothetical protein